LHISDGVLGAPTLVIGGVVALVGVGLGLAATEPRDIPKMSMTAAVFFLASFVHVPVGPVHMHLMLIGLVGLLLGRAVLPAVLVALTFQAILFGYGGWTTLGVNTCVIGLPGIAVYYLLRRWVASDNRTTALAAAFAAGVVGVVAAAALLMLVLITTGQAFVATAKVVFLAHLPLAGAEGVLTLFLVAFLRKVRPQMLAGAAAS